MSAGKRSAPSLWRVRAPVPATTGRALSFVGVGAVFAVWCVATYVHIDRGHGPEPLVPSFFLPPPHEVLKSLIHLFSKEGLAEAIGISTLRIIKAFALSVAVALPVGIAMGSFDVVNRVLDPIVAPLRYLPITAFIPLLILWLGIDEGEKVAFLFLGTVVYLLPVVVDAIRAVPDELVQTAYTLGATRGQIIRTVLIPAAMPQIFDSFRVMNAIAWTYIILAEVVNPRAGIGFILDQAYKFQRVDWMFAGILVVGVIGILTDLGIRGLNSLLFRWREQDA